MIRRFNYTGRIRIRRKDAKFTLCSKGDRFEFNADLRFDEYKLPLESLVFVEAYRQTSWMRFEYGRVGALRPPADRTLYDFDSPESILFRVKVTPPGNKHVLLAEADQIPLVSPEDEDGPRSSLLQTMPQPLGDEVFRLDFDAHPPLLLINSDLGDYRAIGSHPAFVSMALPAVVREILTRVLIVEQHDDEDDTDDWRSQWVRFAKLLPGLGELPDPDDTDARFEWIGQCAAVFAKRHEMGERFETFWRTTES